MQRLRIVTSLDVSAVAGHHAMLAALLFDLAIYGHTGIAKEDSSVFVTIYGHTGISKEASFLFAYLWPMADLYLWTQ